MNGPAYALVNAASQALRHAEHELRCAGWPADVFVEIDDPPTELKVSLRIRLPLPPLPIEAQP